MKQLLVLSLAIAAIAATPINNFVPVRNVLELPSRIISGSPAQRGQFKYQAIVRYPQGGNLFSFCGGSLINSQWILTAAHCIGYSGVMYSIELGALYSDGTPENGKEAFETTRAIAHSNYDNLYLKNDIALIDLQTNVQFSDVIQPIALSYADVSGNDFLTASGWGKTSDDQSHAVQFLNYVTLTSLTNNKCREVWGANIIDGSLCCVGAPEHSICSGDSGGPLVKYNANGQAEQVGLSSYVHPSGCATGNPSVFTRTKFYTQWIANAMNS